MLTKAAYVAGLERAFWAGYHARQRQIEISFSDDFGVETGYQNDREFDARRAVVHDALNQILIEEETDEQ